MPVLSFLGAGAGIASGINQINQGNRQADQIAQQVQLEAEKFGWTKEQTQAELQRRIESSNRFWQDYNSTGAPDYQSEIDRATAELSPLYDKRSKEVVRNLGVDQMRRGFYGQLPGDIQTQEAVAELETAKNQAITGQANQNYQTGLAQRFAEKQLGLGTFGTYGETEVPKIKTSADLVQTPTVQFPAQEKKNPTIGGWGYNGPGFSGGGR